MRCPRLFAHEASSSCSSSPAACAARTRGGAAAGRRVPQRACRAAPQQRQQQHWPPHAAQPGPALPPAPLRRPRVVAARCVAEAQHGSAEQQLQQQQAAAGDSSSSSSSSHSSDDSDGDGDSGGPAVAIKVLSLPHELHAVAALRSEAYYSDDHSRFAGSFKRQFAAQEVESLRQRTAPASASGRPQLCDCLVAVDASTGAVLGCIDIRLPQACTGLVTAGVPSGDAAAAYLLNVVVAEPHRGFGIGKAVMRAAMSRAVHHWRAERLFTHVEADNEVASGLYKSCGFTEHSDEAKFAQATKLGRLVLLVADASVVQPLEASAWAAEE